jgi:hypothetical protein
MPICIVESTKEKNKPGTQQQSNKNNSTAVATLNNHNTLNLQPTQRIYYIPNSTITYYIYQLSHCSLSLKPWKHPIIIRECVLKSSNQSASTVYSHSTGPFYPHHSTILQQKYTYYLKSCQCTFITLCDIVFIILPISNNWQDCVYLCNIYQLLVLLSTLAGF